MSRWLVGSSMRRTSGLPSSTLAIATRIFHPPESSRRVAVDLPVVETQPVTALRERALRARTRRAPDTRAGPRRSARGSLPSRPTAPDRPSARVELDQLVMKIAEAAAPRDRLVEHRTARPSPRRLDGSSRWSSASGSTAPRRRALLHRRSFGRPSSSRIRWGRRAPPSRRGSAERTHRRAGRGVRTVCRLRSERSWPYTVAKGDTPLFHPNPVRSGTFSFSGKAPRIPLCRKKRKFRYGLGTAEEKGSVPDSTVVQAVPMRTNVGTVSAYIEALPDGRRKAWRPSAP